MYEIITSRDNQRIKFAALLAASGAARRSNAQFLVEGLKLCQDLASKQKPKMAFFTQELLQKCPDAQTMAQENFLVQPHVAAKLGSTKTPQGIFCVFDTPTYTVDDLRLNDGVLICETMQDPANIGAVLRSAAGLGMGGVVFCSDSADPFSPKALRASMGAALRIPMLHGGNALEICEALRKKGVHLYAAALDEAVPVQEVQVESPFALIIGNEGAGLTQDVANIAQNRVYLPMHAGIESLNAAGAAAILMYHFRAAKGGV